MTMNIVDAMELSMPKGATRVLVRESLRKDFVLGNYDKWLSRAEQNALTFCGRPIVWAPDAETGGADFIWQTSVEPYRLAEVA